MHAVLSVRKGKGEVQMSKRRVLILCSLAKFESNLRCCRLTLSRSVPLKILVRQFGSCEVREKVKA